MVILDLLESTPAPQAHDDSDPEASDKEIDAVDTMVTFEEAFTKTSVFWAEFATANPRMNAANVPKSRMGAASWAACQKIPCLDSDGFELFGPEFFSLGDIKEELTMMVAEVVDVTMIVLQDIVAFVGLDWSSFYLGLCTRLHPNQQQDHIQVHYFGSNIGFVLVVFTGTLYCL
jgi:hypothetical protein